jgi:2-desacetyl-2-hydroxyethyl bacteriochlorophyllide A dehydrogenase
MRCAVWQGEGRIELTEVDLGAPGPGQVRVDVEYTGLCGTDLAILHGQHPRAITPLIMGHEIAGVVGACGAGVDLMVGDGVVVEPLISCGICRACRSGNAHVCRALMLYGIDAPGGLAESVLLPASAVHRVPAGTDLAVAVLAEPLAVAVHAVARSGMQRGDVVAVVGGGPIGVLTALVAQRVGAAHLVLAEPNAWRRDAARALGLDAVDSTDALERRIGDLSEGEGADVTFDAAGIIDVSIALTRLTRMLGTVTIVGVHKLPAPVDLRRVNFAEQTIVGTRVYTSADVGSAVGLLADPLLRLADIPRTVFPLDRVADAFAEAERGSCSLKAIVAPGKGAKW